MLDMPHEDNDCEKVKLAKGIHRLKKAYEKFSGKTFDRSGFLNAFSHEDVDTGAANPSCRTMLNLSNT